QAGVRADGQEHHAGGRQWRRPDHQGGEPDRSRIDHRRGRRGLAVCRQGRRRSGQGAPGPDGWPGHFTHPRHPGRAHDQAQFRSGLSDCTAPERFEPRIGRSEAIGLGAARHVECPAVVQRLRLSWWCGLGSFGHGARAGKIIQLRNRPKTRLSRTAAPSPRSLKMAQETPQALLRRLFDAAVASAQPALCIPPHMPSPDDLGTGRLIVIGAGKASAAMARAVEDHWRGPLSGLVVTRYGYAVPCQRIEIVEAAHPVPDAAGLAAAERMLRLVQGLKPQDMVLCLISGGGSSLLPLPAPGLTLDHKQDVNRELLKSGATISEMNCVRRHLSAIKGGRLAAACHPARVLTLLLSDVPGDNPIDIASGPTVADSPTCDDALAIIRRYGLQVPAAVLEVLE